MASTLDFDATAGASSAPADADDAYYLEQVTLDDDDDEYEYAEVEVDEEEEEGEDDEDLEKVMATIQSKADGASPARTRVEPARGEVTRRPEVLDDFIRNVLLKMQMGETLDMFQREWHRMQAEGKLSSGDMGTVPDIYLRNQQLDDQLKDMGAEIEKMKQISAAAKGTWDKFRKERDFHKMHHKRVVQEKNKLILPKCRRCDCSPPSPPPPPPPLTPHTSSLQAHYEHYEPMLKMMQTKYEAAMKEKMLGRPSATARLARRRPRGAAPPGRGRARRRGRRRRRAGGEGAEGAARLAAARGEPREPVPHDGPPRAQGRALGPEDLNAHTLGVADVAAYPPNRSSPPPPTTVRALASPSAVAFPQTRPTRVPPPQARGRCSRSPRADHVGRGHKDWLSSSTLAARLAPRDGVGRRDGSVGVRAGEVRADLGRAHGARLGRRVPRLRRLRRLGVDGPVREALGRRHRQGEAGVPRPRGFRQLRLLPAVLEHDRHRLGRQDGVALGLPLARVQTFYGHQNAVNDTAFAMRGDVVASTDADGQVRLWDVRMVAEIATINCSPQGAACNGAAFDAAASRSPSAATTASSASSTSRRARSATRRRATTTRCRPLPDRKGKYLVTAGADCTFRLFCWGSVESARRTVVCVR